MPIVVAPNSYGCKNSSMIIVFVKSISLSTVIILVPLTSLRIWFNILEPNTEIQHHFIRELVEDGSLTLKFIHTDDQKADIFTKPLDSKRFKFLHKNIGVISIGWSTFPFFSPHALAHSFYALLCLTCFCLVVFRFSLFFLIIKKNEKSEKYKNSVCYVYIGTCVPWIAIETEFSTFCIFCILYEHLYAQLSKWTLWLLFVMSKIELSLILNTHITLFDGKD